MQVLFFFQTEKQTDVENVLSKEPIVRQSILMRSAGSLGLKREGNVVLVEGSEEACKEAEMALRHITEEVKGKEKDETIRKIKEAEDRATEGFGHVFG